MHIFRVFKYRNSWFFFRCIVLEKGWVIAYSIICWVAGPQEDNNTGWLFMEVKQLICTLAATSGRSYDDGGTGRSQVT